MVMELRVIPFSQWAEGISPLWNCRPEDIQPYNNPYGMIMYREDDVPHKILFFPCALEVDGQIVAYSSIYNISDTVLRIRGIYVLPDHRGKGYGYDIARMMGDGLFPHRWSSTIGYWRDDSYGKFIERGGWERVGRIPEIRSTYTDTTIRMLRRRNLPLGSRLNGIKFIESMIGTYGLYGSNNRPDGYRPAHLPQYSILSDVIRPDLPVLWTTDLDRLWMLNPRLKDRFANITVFAGESQCFHHPWWMIKRLVVIDDREIIEEAGRLSSDTFGFDDCYISLMLSQMDGSMVADLPRLRDAHVPLRQHDPSKRSLPRTNQNPKVSMVRHCHGYGQWKNLWANSWEAWNHAISMASHTRSPDSESHLGLNRMMTWTDLNHCHVIRPTWAPESHSVYGKVL